MNKELSVHWRKQSTDYTICGVMINGHTIRRSHFPQYVTCTECLKYLAKTSVCPECGCEFLKGDK